METSTGAIVDGKMEPIARQEDTGPQLVVTGQYLFDNFIEPDDTQITKMQMIRRLSEIADALQIKGACDKMVELAVKVDYPEGKPKKADRLTKEQTAMNARTVITQAWGALKFARVELDNLGYSDRTGYQDMRVMAKKALDTRGIKWEGSAIPSDADKEVARLKREQAAETKALVEVQKDNPRLKDETLGDWQTRTLELAYEAMDQAREEATDKAVNDAVEALIEKHDNNRLFRIAEALALHLGVDIVIHNEETQPEAETETA